MKVLVVVDMQNDFITGSLGTKEAQAVVSNVVEKVKKFDGKIFFTKDTHFPDYLSTQEGQYIPIEHCINGTKGIDICNELLPYVNDNINVCYKYTFGSIDLPSMIESQITNLDNITEIEICGLCTGICVISNALILKAAFPEIKITVDASCCACVTPESHKRALEAMKLCQIDIINE